MAMVVLSPAPSGRRTASVSGAPRAGHPGLLSAIAFSADGKLIATAGQDAWARVWDAETGEEIVAFEHAGVVETVAFSPDRRRLVPRSRDGTARVGHPAGPVE